MHVCDICNYKGKMKRFEAVDCNENLSDKVYTYFSCPDCGTMRLASPLGGGANGICLKLWLVRSY